MAVRGLLLSHRPHCDGMQQAHAILCEPRYGPVYFVGLPG